MNVPIDFDVVAFEVLIRQKIEMTLIMSLNLLKNECVRNVPVDRGDLRDSIRVEGVFWASPYYIEGRVVAGGPNIPQAFFMEFGTPAHGPKTARMMHFFWQGKEIFTKWVAGSMPLYWMTNSLNFALPQIRLAFKALEAESRGFIFTVTGRGS